MTSFQRNNRQSYIICQNMKFILINSINVAYLCSNWNLPAVLNGEKFIEISFPFFLISDSGSSLRGLKIIIWTPVCFNSTLTRTSSSALPLVTRINCHTQPQLTNSTDLNSASANQLGATKWHYNHWPVHAKL